MLKEKSSNTAKQSKMKSAQRRTLRALGCSKVRTPRPPAVTNPQTGPIKIHCAAAS